jgi:hypothetical protein
VKGNDAWVLRIPALALSLVLVTAGLSGCALLDDVGDSDLDDALELVPGDATFVTITNRQAAAERLGIDDVETGADQDDLDRYIEASVDADSLMATTRLGRYLVPMAQHAAFSELDVVWEAAATGDDQGFASTYKMSDDLDLDAVGDDLVDAGYQEDEIAGHRHLYIEDVATDTDFDGMIGGYPGVEMTDLVVVPDEHLMFVAHGREEVEEAVDVLEDDADSATDTGDFDEVLDGADDPELAVLAHDVGCSPGGNLSAEQLEQAGLDGLGTPEATAFFVSGDDAETSSVLAFADDGAAEADLEAREDYLADGVLLKTRQPIADVATWDLERDGDLVRIDYEYDDPRMAWAAATSSDGFHACNPG